MPLASASTFSSVSRSRSQISSSIRWIVPVFVFCGVVSSVAMMASSCFLNSLRVCNKGTSRSCVLYKGCLDVIRDSGDIVVLLELGV